MSHHIHSKNTAHLQPFSQEPCFCSSSFGFLPPPSVSVLLKPLQQKLILSLELCGKFWSSVSPGIRTVSSNLPILSLGKELVGSNPLRNSVRLQLPSKGGSRFSSSDPKGKSISRSQINRIVLIQVGPAHWNYCQQLRAQGQTLTHMWETRFRLEGPQA